MWKLVQEMPSTKLTGYLFHNNHDLTFSNVTAGWGITKKSIHNGVAYADLNNDGKLDLIINNLNDEATIYKNNGDAKTHSHFIKLRLKGSGKNTFGIGAKVYVETEHGKQMQEQYTSRGFQSSVDPVMHIGLGSDSIIKSIVVKWQGGNESKLENVRTDTTLVIDQNTSSVAPATLAADHKKQFQDITNKSGINYTNHQSAFVDFKIMPWLPYQLSKTGPCITKADVNGDGLEDLFIGGSAGQESILYLQTKDGKFIAASNQPWNTEKNFTVSDALFFDADGDGDLDLYLVSGGDDYPLNSKNYQDRIFENDGHGNFKKIDDALPVETVSGSCVRAADIDHDNLPDLFVGGYVRPGLFPDAPESFILKNKSTKGKIKFEKDVQQTDTTLAHPGMVADAVWIDINKDGWMDLVVVGKFMPITIFENHNGKLSNETKKYGLENTQGWWCKIIADDFDKDGNTDFVIGNLGNNSQFKASANEPLTITYADFNNDGVFDPVLCYYNQGKSYPFFTRDELFDQIPSLQKKFGRYADYADAQLKDIFSEEQLAKAKTVEMKMTESVLLRNDGNNKFTITALPAYAQISTVNGIIADDVDGDGNKDMIIAGNFFPFRAQQGPLDASMGAVLKGDGKGGFMQLPYTQTGLCIPGDVRDIIKIKQGNSFIIVAAKNNGAIQIIKKTN